MQWPQTEVKHGATPQKHMKMKGPTTVQEVFQGGGSNAIWGISGIFLPTINKPRTARGTMSKVHTPMTSIPISNFNPVEDVLYEYRVVYFSECYTILYWFKFKWMHSFRHIIVNLPKNRSEYLIVCIIHDLKSAQSIVTIVIIDHITRIKIVTM